MDKNRCASSWESSSRAALRGFAAGPSWNKGKALVNHALTRRMAGFGVALGGGPARP